MKQIPLAITPLPDMGFDSLLVGPNAQAVQHLRSLATPSAPVYLWGPSGSGKTHLLRALADSRQSQGERVGWFDAHAALPWAFDEGWTLVVVDDCQALDPARQHAAFALFVEAGGHGVQWAAAGKLPPVDLPIRDDLRTRLGWGHVFAMQALAEGETRAALRREADRRGIFLSDEVMDYLLTRFQRDLKHLMSLLDQLDAFALSERRAVTVPLLKKMLVESTTPDSRLEHPA
ncbi:MAG: DnaA regulatory inactivator Hda [Ideonella sp.]|jgi:DnaA-homolog protein|nr:DnaA regulatory inactivator Hda [Ideonella sp.]MBL0149772.1 DnaA regulatory inactivator Hda [Ideonella sp.]